MRRRLSWLRHDDDAMRGVGVGVGVCMRMSGGLCDGWEQQDELCLDDKSDGIADEWAYCYTDGCTYSYAERVAHIVTHLRTDHCCTDQSADAHAYGAPMRRRLSWLRHDDDAMRGVGVGVGVCMRMSGGLCDGWEQQDELCLDDESDGIADECADRRALCCTD